MSGYDPILDEELELPDGKKLSMASLTVIDEENLSDEYAHHAAWLTYVGVLAAEAEAEWKVAKLATEELVAELDTIARHTLFKSGKFTEAMVSAWIHADHRYHDVSEAEILAYRSYKICKALEYGMRERGGQLISLGAKVRQELDTTYMQLRMSSTED